MRYLRAGNVTYLAANEVDRLRGLMLANANAAQSSQDLMSRHTVAPILDGITRPPTNPLAEQVITVRWDDGDVNLG